MKKIFILGWLVLFLFASCTNTLNTVPKVQADKNKIVYEKNSSEPFTGILEERMRTGEIIKKTHYVNGKKDGEEEEYQLVDSQNKLLAKRRYKNGELEFANYYLGNEGYIETIDKNKKESERTNESYYTFSGSIKKRTYYKNSPEYSQPQIVKTIEYSKNKGLSDKVAPVALFPFAVLGYTIVGAVFIGMVAGLVYITRSPEPVGIGLQVLGDIKESDSREKYKYEE